MILILLGYLPEKDASGKEKWPLGDEKVWKAGMRTVDKGLWSYFPPTSIWVLTRA